MAAAPANSNLGGWGMRFEARNSHSCSPAIVGHALSPDRGPHVTQSKVTSYLLVKDNTSTDQQLFFNTFPNFVFLSDTWLLSTWKGPSVTARNLPPPPLRLFLPSYLIVFAQLEAKLICSIFR